MRKGRITSVRKGRTTSTDWLTAYIRSLIVVHIRSPIVA